MGFQPTEAVEETVMVPETQELDTFQILQVTILLDPNDPTAASAGVNWAEGYMDGETFVAVKLKSAHCAGPSFLAAITAQVEEGETRYDTVKKGFWTYLEAQGLIPAGSIV